MPDPGPGPARFSASLKVRDRKYGFALSGDAARLLAAVMVLCTLLAGAEVLAGIAWLIARVA